MPDSGRPGAVTVIEAMAPGDELTESGVGPASPNTIAKVRIKKQRHISPPPAPEPALPPPGDDSIDIALAELDAES
jgi:hypothetical protein